MQRQLGGGVGYAIGAVGELGDPFFDHPEGVGGSGLRIRHKELKVPIALFLCKPVSVVIFVAFLRFSPPSPRHEEDDRIRLLVSVSVPLHCL